MSKLFEQSKNEELRKKIYELRSNKSYVFVDLGLTNEEFCLLDQLNFDKLSSHSKTQYDRFGSLHLLKDELPLFLGTIGSHDEKVIKAVTEIIFRTANNVIRATNKTSAWVCVRVSPPSSMFDIPRWHRDGAYFELKDPSKPLLKFAAVLKGPPTLLYPLPNEMKETFNCHWNHRILLSQLLDVNRAESPKRGEGVFFIVGDDHNGAVHSEPKMSENRIFFSVLAGDDSEIQELYRRWFP